MIFSGGLGPTEDDLTREAVAQALGVSLHRDAQVLAGIDQRFATRGWKMSANNAKQADVLEGATVLPNPNGTAPGQWFSGQIAEPGTHRHFIARASARIESFIRSGMPREAAGEIANCLPGDSSVEGCHAR